MHPNNGVLVRSVTRALRQVWVAVFALLLVSVPAFSQAQQGTIRGSVFDQSGGVVADATVTVIDVARGVSHPITTDSAGAYAVPNLIPGTYTVRAEAKGFQTVEQANVLLEVGQTIRVDLTLRAGGQTQTVTVTSAAPAISTTDVTLGGTLNNQIVTQLPIKGRDFKMMLSLRPAITSVPGGCINCWSANGTRGEDIGYMIDGLTADEPYTGNSAINSPVPAGAGATSLPLDAVQEMNIEQNPKAEFGWKPGAIVNIGFKSGTNSLHGTAFAFGRDTALTTRNYFNPPPDPQVPMTFEQFGGSMGGRIIKDKLFWFADYEGQKYSVGDVIPTTTPATVSLATTANPLGDPANSLVDACNNLKANNIAISPLSAHIAGLDTATCTVKPTNYTPGPDLSVFPTNTSADSYYLNLLNTNWSHNSVAKMDYTANEHNTISGTFSYDVGQGIFSGTGNTIGLPRSNDSPFMQVYGPTTVQLYLGSWNWVPTSTIVNQLRVGYTRFNQDYHAQDYQTDPLAFGINTGVTDPRIFGFPTVAITGFTGQLGGGQHKVVGPDGLIQFHDDVSLIRGNHSFKFGGDFIVNRLNNYQNSNGTGTFRFSNLQDFLTGTVANNGTGTAILAGDPTRKLSNYQYALFGQDDWRITRRLTLNLGLRWEYWSVLKEANNLMGNFDPTQGLVQVGKQVNSLYNGDFNNFGPRVGFAWDVTGSGKTVVRASAGIMYEYLPIQDYVAAQQKLGLTQEPTGATFYDAANPNGVAGPGNIQIVNQNLSGAQVTPGWQAQTQDCVTGGPNGGGTTACGPIFPTSTFKFECGDGLTKDSSGSTPTPCLIVAIDPNIRTGYLTTWTFGIDRQITSTLALNVSYVGTHGTKLPGILDINEPAVGSGYTAAQLLNGGDPSTVNTKAIQTARPFYSQFPYLSNIDMWTNVYSSNYNALQVTLTQRNWHGLNFLAGYTYSHALGGSASDTFINTPVVSSNPKLLYGNLYFDMRQRFNFSTTYDIPGRKSPVQLLEGWQVNSVVTLESPMPWGPIDQTNDFAGNGSNANSAPLPYGGFWNFFGNTSDFNNAVSPAGAFPCWSGSSAKTAIPASGCSLGSYYGTPGNPAVTTAPTACTDAATKLGTNYVNTLNSVGCYVVGNSVLIPPALGTIGNAGPNIFRGPNYRNLDLSVNKTWKFTERFSAQFRAQFYNILNHPIFWDLGAIGHAGKQYDYPNKAQFGCSCVTPDQAGNLVLGDGGARAITLGLKLLF